MKMYQFWYRGEAPALADDMKRTCEEQGIEYERGSLRSLMMESDIATQITISHVVHTLPETMAAAVISDYWRFKKLSETGGWYCDCDVVAKWIPRACEGYEGLMMTSERTNRQNISTAVMFAGGKSGIECASRICKRLHEKMVGCYKDLNRALKMSEYLVGQPFGLVDFIGPGFIRWLVSVGACDKI